MSKNQNEPRKRMKKIVLLTYEFTFSPFSGNGILARSLVKSFLGLGCRVLVWCCRPSDSAENSSDNPLAPPEISVESMGRLEVVSNVVLSDGWKRVDYQSCWRDFTISQLSPNEEVHRLQSSVSDADVVCVIDWSGAIAYRSIVGIRDITSKFHLYLNFRVYSLGVDNEEQKSWYDKMEYEGMKHASAIVSLSSKDSEKLSTILQQNGRENPGIPIEIVLPPLRQDMESLAKSGKTSEDILSHLPDSIRSRLVLPTKEPDHWPLSPRRPFLTCVARQSPEKCIQRFVTFVEQSTDTLQELQLTVVLAGAVSDVTYAQRARQRLLRALPCSSVVLLDRFLSPNELGALFAHTLLNFHPSSYDAYGMTIVEAAAFGAPTVLAGPSVGAFRLLGDDGCLQVDMSDPNESIFSDASLNTILGFLRHSLKDEDSWEKLSARAREKALAWDEKSYGERMLTIIDTHSTTAIQR